MASKETSTAKFEAMVILSSSESTLETSLPGVAALANQGAWKLSGLW